MINELKKNDLLPQKKMEEILRAERIISKPTVIIESLSDEELKILIYNLDLEKLEKLPEGERPYWLEDLKEFLENKKED